MNAIVNSLVGMSIALAALVGSAPADAALARRFVQLNGSGMCTLSIPTIDTKVRPKATGFRNEGTANAFVICNFTSLPGNDGGTGIPSDPEAVALLPYSIDGADHAVTCTAVNSAHGFSSLGGVPQQYVSKTLTVNNTGTFGDVGTEFLWAPADFGGTDYIPAQAGFFSITCNLPPNVAINVGLMQGDEEIGS